MRERPILFKDAMVKAILEGRKTQTRRIINPQPALRLQPMRSLTDDEVYWCHEDGRTEGAGTLEYSDGSIRDLNTMKVKSWKCPYASRTVERLWVRESYSYITKAENEQFDRRHPDGYPVSMLYRADSVWDGMTKGDFPFNWSNSMFMPRWASRILLEVSEVRTQRLQDISYIEIRAEGVGCPEHDFPSGFCMSECRSLRATFRSLWESIHGKGSWDENPWLWVIRFHKLNTDKETT